MQHPDDAYLWHDFSNYIVCLSVEDEFSLISLFAKANERGLKCSCFHEPDLGGEMTSITLEPSDASRRLCSNLPLAMKGLGNGVDKNNYKTIK